MVCRQKENVDFHLDSPNVSRNHAAVVHHNNGNTYLIDLQSVRNFVLVSGVRVHAVAGCPL